MNEKTIKAIQDALAPLAEKVGQGASHLYQLYVKQAYIVGLQEVIWGILLLIITIIFWAFIHPKVSTYAEKQVKEDKFSNWDDGLAVIRVFGLLFATFFVLMSIGLFSDAVAHFLNPEYQALQDLISQVRRY